MQTLTVVQASEDRWQVLDARGHQLAGYPNQGLCDAFVQGYKLARDDARAMVAKAIEGLEVRVAGH